MASSTVKKRKRRSQAKGGGSFVPQGRKREVLGLILMVLAVLVGLALFTYSAQDDAIARTFSLSDAFDPGENRAANALGLVGAVIAIVLVRDFLGYSVIILTGLVFAWGYLFFRRREALYLPLVSVLTVTGTFSIACLFGWLHLVSGAELSLWSGEIGLGAAGWLRQIFGTAGSVILLLLALSVTILLLVDHDIQRSIDRFGQWTAAVKSYVAQWISVRVEQYREGRRERVRRAEERRTERASEPDEKPSATGGDATSSAGDAGDPRGRASQLARDGGISSSSSPRPSPDSTPSRTVNDLYRADERPASARTDLSSPGNRVSPSQDDESPSRPPTSNEPELHVQERIEEERADSVERDTDIPDEKLAARYRFPSVDLLDERDISTVPVDYEELEENKRILLDKLDTYNVEITGINAIVGPTVTLYELTPAPGVKISRITSLEDDLAMAMAAKGIRIIAPIPGKSAVGVEIPNRHRELVQIRDVIGTARFRDSTMELPIPIGKTIEGEVFMADLAKLPHLLIAGATGSGKSVGLNTLITGLLYACHPANLKFVMIDPKKIELQQYNQIADHYVAMPENGKDPIITDFEEALDVFKSCEREMEERYDLLSEASVRSIEEYNRKLADGRLDADKGFEHLPYIVVIVDELADLMMTAGKDIEGPIARLAQMARAVGIHLVLATQRPSVDVITGLIKANFPARIAFQVASKVDSRTILDQNGAEGLVGNGDLLYMLGSRIVRLQGPFVSVEEVDRIVEYIADQKGPGPYLLPPSDEHEGPDDILGVEDTDELFEEAARIIVRAQQGSVSLLQRKMSVGYTRAARIVDQLEEAGIVGPFVGSKARDVLVDSIEELENLLAASKESNQD
ncbi:MAG: DNA translocase FtsK [Rhodothermales bacterium]